MTQASRLHLVDLAGSERVKESKVNGDGVREAGNINQSLMVLGNVVTALEDKASKRRRGDVSGAARVHVPYRDAKLTRLLQDALGGNAYAAILCCVSRAAADASHTTSTLRFASRLKSVTTAPRKNLDPKVRDSEQEIDLNVTWSRRWRRGVYASRKGVAVVS